MPFTIGIIAQGGRDWAGGMELTRNLIRSGVLAAKAANLDVDFVILASGDEFDPTIDELRGIFPVRKVALPNVSPSIFGRLLARFVHPRALATAIRSEQIDFLYPIIRAPGNRRCRSAVWIADLQYRHLPHLFPAGDREGRARYVKKAVKHADTIVLSSKSAEADLLDAFPQARGRTRVLRFRTGVPAEWLNDDAISVARRYNLPARYLIVCNQFWSHKNHLVLIEGLMSALTRNPDISLVLTGRLNDYREPNLIDRILARIHQGGLHEKARFLGLIPKRDQIQLVRASCGVVQPSLFEGWNTLVEEAHALGKSIGLSDLAVHREQNPPGSLFFDPKSPAEIANVLVSLWKSDDSNSIAREQQAFLEYQERFREFGENLLNLACGGFGPESRRSRETEFLT